MLMPLLLGAFALTHPGPWPGMHQDFEAPTATWVNVTPVLDGVAGRAASFNEPGKPGYADLGECPIAVGRPFTLTVSLRTTDGSFSTPLIARNGENVGLSVIMGREPGKVSFEAWSWQSVKLISKTRVDDGKWHTVKVEYDNVSTCAVLYIDGKLEAAGALGEGSSPNAMLRVGNNIGADQPYHGQIDELTLTPTLDHPERFAGLAPFTTREQKAAELKAWREKLLPAHAPHAPGTKEEWEKNRFRIRQGVLHALHITEQLSVRNTRAQVYNEVVGHDVRVQRITFSTAPACEATGWLWTAETPDPAGAPYPAMLMPHGHWAGGAIDPVVQVRAARFARAGYVVLVPDSVHVENVAKGLSACGVMLNNNMGALSLLCSRDDVDPARIGVTGASGGAQQTMYLMATDDRIAAAAPVCMICDFNQILAEDWAHCGCNHAPGIAAIADQPTMCAVFAPKPVFYISVTGDWTHAFPTDNLPGLEAIYALEGAPKAIESKQFNAGHGYDAAMRARVYQFFDPLLKPRHPEATEEGFVAFERNDLKPDFAQSLGDEHLARLMDNNERVESVAALAPSVDWHIQPVPLAALGPPVGGWQRYTVKGPDGVTIGLIGRGLEDGTAAITVVATDDRAKLLLSPPSWLAADICPRIAIMEPRFTGDWAPFTSAWRRNGLLLGAGEGYVQARDIAQVVASLPGDPAVRMIALGSTGVPALLALEFMPRCRTLLVEDCGPSFASDGNRTPLCPDILRLGNTNTLLRNTKIDWHHRLIGGAGEPALSEKQMHEMLEAYP
jgi:hypothetical protein